MVIIIIILLILAGVAISQLTNNGLFEQVQNAKQKQEISKQDENEKIEKYKNDISKYSDSIVDLSKDKDIENDSRGSNSRYDVLWSGSNGNVGNDTSNVEVLSHEFTLYDRIDFTVKTTATQGLESYSVDSQALKSIVDQPNINDHFLLDGWSNTWIWLHFKNDYKSWYIVVNSGLYAIIKVVGIKF